MRINKRILWITQSALFLALIISTQAGTAALGQLLTGSLVNMMLILCVMLCGLAPGLTVALLSPLFAKLLGIGPLWEIVPLISAGNAIIVLIWFFIGKIKLWQKYYVPHIAALIIGAAAKFLFLFLTVAKLMVPLLNMPAPQAAKISATFSVTQLFTALIGGALAVIMLPLLKKALKTRQT